MLAALLRSRVYDPAKRDYLVASAAATLMVPESAHSFFSESQALPANPKFRSNSISFQRSSSESLLFQAFILVLGTPSEMRQNQTESEYSFIRSPLRKSLAPALTGLPSLPWQLAQFTSGFVSPMNSFRPSSALAASAHQPAGICLSAYSAGAGGGGTIGPSPLSQAATSSPRPITQSS